MNGLNNLKTNNMTAVEWLVNVVQSCIAPDYIPTKIIEQAKEMERQELERMYSEDEVDELVNNLISKFLNYNGSSIDSEKLKWFYQQLKKK